MPLTNLGMSSYYYHTVRSNVMVGVAVVHLESWLFLHPQFATTLQLSPTLFVLKINFPRDFDF